jgi:hypothetical protein
MTMATALLWTLLGAPWLAIAILVAIWVRAARRLARLEGRQRRLTEGIEAEHLGAVLDGHLDRVEKALTTATALQSEIVTLRRNAQGAVQHVGIVRFNPFYDTGGDQSFALALADGRGDGVVICNLHGRGESRLYAKPLSGWRSAYSLSDEEQLAVQKAQGLPPPKAPQPPVAVDIA